MCVKLRKSTVVVIITSWILFLLQLFWHMRNWTKNENKKRTYKMKKIFQQTTQKNTSQGVIRETNDDSGNEEGRFRD